MTNNPTSDQTTARYALKAHDIGAGMHPNESVYSIYEFDGSTTESFAWRIENGAVEVGYVGRRGDGAHLVELPQETVDGRWRVWVKPEEIVIP